jgi:hypothetical protein
MIRNNLVVVNGGNGIEMSLNRADSAASEATAHSNTVVEVATPTGSRATSLLLVAYEGTDVRAPNGILRNNIAACASMRSNQAAFRELGSSGIPRIVENNDLWGCSTLYATNTGVVLSSVAGVNMRVGATGNVSVDPAFVAPPADYHLQPTSPVIDRGTTSGPPVTTDFDGEMRPRGGGPDIGFDEAG